MLMAMAKCYNEMVCNVHSWEWLMSEVRVLCLGSDCILFGCMGINGVIIFIIVMIIIIVIVKGVTSVIIEEGEIIWSFSGYW